MAKLSTMKFKGNSGMEYSFDVYPIETTWRDGVAAVYFVTRRYQKDDGKYYHEELYVGQTADLRTRHASHHRQGCFDRHNANCLCILQEPVEQQRLAIERDLIQGRNPTCNRQ